MKSSPTPPQPSVHNAEIIIIGGGLGGLVLANALGASGMRVLLVDDQPSLARPSDSRTTALSRSSWHALTHWGVMIRTVQKAACPIMRIRVADRDLPPPLDFDAHDVGGEPLGWIVDNATLRTALCHAIDQRTNVQILSRLSVVALTPDDACMRVTCADGRVLTAALIAGVDGRGSPSRTMMGIETFVRSYHQTAIVCTVRHPFPHHNTAVENFRTSGPLATLPMTGSRSSIVWCESPETAAYLATLSERAILAILAERVGDWLGKPLKLDSKLSMWPLTLVRARRLIGTRGVLISDAAHGIHPIAGQGLNLGIRDMISLAATLTHARALGLDLGSPHVLAHYERSRRADVGTFVMAMDQLVHIFGSTFPLVRAGRRLGLGIIGRVPPLKRALMRAAMGSNSSVFLA